MGFKADKKFVAILMSGLLLVIVGQVVPLLGSTVEDSYDMPVDTAGTATYDQSGVSVHLQILTVGTETYTVTNTTTAAFDVPVGVNMTATKLIEELVAEITASSTLITAVDNGDNTTTITSVLEDAAGNYATTENMTNGEFISSHATQYGAVMTGGVTGSEWEDVTNTSDVWGNLVTILGAALSLLAIFYAISPIIGKLVWWKVSIVYRLRTQAVSSDSAFLFTTITNN
jgi:hypothetical protein